MEKSYKVILVSLYGLKKHERMLGYKLVLFNILSVFKKGKSSCFWRISSKGISNILLVVVARLRRMSENLVRSADRFGSNIRAMLKNVVNVVLITDHGAHGYSPRCVCQLLYVLNLLC